MQELQTTQRLEELIPLVTRTVASPITKRDYARELTAFFSWYDALPWLHAEGFCRSAVMQYREAMQNAGREPVSVNKALSAIRRLAREAADSGLLAQETAARIESVEGVKRHESTRGNWLTLDQLKKLLTSEPPTTPNRGVRDRAAICIMGLCGLRRDEAADLRLRQFGRRDDRPVLLDVRGKGVGSKKLRTVPVHEFAEAAIRRWVLVAGLQDPDAYLLPTIANPDTITARQCAGGRLYDACRRYCAALELEFRPHDLRRTFATLAKRGGADYEEIRQALGHSSIATTEIYLRAAESLENAATDKIKL